MKLVDDWKRILFTGYSTVALFLGLLVLAMPNVAFRLWEVELDPYRLGDAALALFAVGLFGRVVDQKRSHPVFKIPLQAVILWALFVVGSSISGGFDDYRLKQIEVKPIEITRAEVTHTDEFGRISFDLISKWEGKRNVAYLDPVNVPTICYGHTRTIDHADVRAKVRWPDERCRELLIEEIAEYRDKWLEYTTDETRAERLPHTRTAAYTSLAFNVGWTGAGKSTATRRLNAGDIVGGCEAITWWNKAGGRVMRGLVNRRSEEQELCLA